MVFSKRLLYLFTLPKTNIAPKTDDFQKKSPFPVLIFRFHVKLQGVWRRWPSDMAASTVSSTLRHVSTFSMGIQPWCREMNRWEERKLVIATHGSFIGLLRGGVPRGGGNWGTLRIPREDWGTLRIPKDS